MARIIFFCLFLGVLTTLYSIGTRHPKTSGEAIEVVSFVELPAKEGDEFRYCALEVRSADGSLKTVKLKAKKTLVANSVEGFVRSMLPF